MAKLTRTVNYANFRWEEYVLTDEELKQWKTGDEDIQQDIIDDADWDLVRDKPIDNYGDVEFCRRRLMVEFFKHAFGLCGEHWHPNIWTFLLGGLGLQQSFFVY